MTYLALLRAVNLGPSRKVAMGDLRQWVAGLGFSNPRTLLQSGNLLFDGRARATSLVERTLEASARAGLGLEVDFFVRSPDEWEQVIAGNPFRQEAARDPGHLLVLFLKAPADAKRVRALQAAISGREVVSAGGRHLYAVYPDGIGRSRLTVPLIEKTLQTRATGRNWNTVRKMADALT